MFYGLLTGALIAAYTLNDGWAVKVLLISPFVIDFTGNLFRMVVLAPRAWRDRARVALEARIYRKPVIVVSVLGPLGYILVLVRDAPGAREPRCAGAGVVDAGGRVVRFAAVARGFGSVAHRRRGAHRRRRHQPRDARLTTQPVGQSAAPGELGQRRAQFANARRLA